ncbi:MAG: thioredoxin-dependent thiol peroxidase [bacterium]
MSEMTKMTEGIQEGELAPDFSLPDAQGKMVRLSDFRDRPVVIYFYPKDFTPGCTQEACDFRDNYQPLQELGAVVLGVSPDDAQSHQKFILEHQLPFTLLADTSREVIKKYGFWGVKYLYGRQTEGVIRSTVIVDGEGKVRKVWKNVKVDGHIQEVIQELGRITQRK